jgi:hypothetical protein
MKEPSLSSGAMVQSKRKRLRPPNCNKGRPLTPPAREVKLAGRGEGGAMPRLMGTANCLERLAREEAGVASWNIVQVPSQWGAREGNF